MRAHRRFKQTVRAADTTGRLGVMNPGPEERMSGERMDCWDAGGADRRSGKGEARPYIGILFECCGVYARVYRRPAQRCYSGRCPKCLRTIHVRVGPDGTSTRLFRAS